MEPQDLTANNQIMSLETRVGDILGFLRSLRNRLRPVNRLPPEIISYIARWILQAEGEPHTKALIPLTHVCQYWRDSIVSTPGNWTRIWNGRWKLAELSLERAKAAPLDIVLTFNLGEGLSRTLLPYIQRASSISCTHFSTIAELTQGLPDFPKSTPNLRSLTFDGCGLDLNRGHSIDPFDFSTHVTTLKKLALHDLPLFPSFLSLRSLTELDLRDYHLNLHVDTLLNFLGKNQSLESATFDINFEEPSLRHSQRRTPVGKLQRLSIWCDDVVDARTLISNVGLQKGGTLEIVRDDQGGLIDIFSGIPITHLSSPTYMEYRTLPRSIRLVGPDGSFLYINHFNAEAPFGEEFLLLPLACVRELRLECYRSWVSPQFDFSFFPSLEILAINGNCPVDGSNFSDGGSIIPSLSPVLPDPASSPSLKVLAFLDCIITEDFASELAQNALDRKYHNSASLLRVLIMTSKSQFPSPRSIGWLRMYVPVVQLLIGKELPKDLL